LSEDGLATSDERPAGLPGNGWARSVLGDPEDQGARELTVNLPCHIALEDADHLELRSGGSGLHSEQSPSPLDALEFVLGSVFEADP